MKKLIQIKNLWPLLLCAGLLAGCVEGKEAAVPAERNEAEITSFYFTQLHNPDVADTADDSGIEGRVDAEIDQQTRTIFLQFPVGGVNLTALKASFESSFGSVVKIGQTAQLSNISENDFTQSLTYTVVSEDGSVAIDYVVTVVNGQNTATDLFFFTFLADGMDDDGAPTTDNINCVIDVINGRILGEVKYEVDLAAVTPAFRAAPRAKVYIGSVEQVSGTSVVNLSAPVTYRVEAEDGTSLNYQMEISKLPAWTEKDLLSLSFSKTNNPLLDMAAVSIGDNTVTITVGSGFDATAMIPDFTISPKATAKIGAADLIAGNAHNFETPGLTLTVIAQDGSTHVYTITLQRMVIGALIFQQSGVNGATLNTSGDIYTFSSMTNGATATSDAAGYPIPGTVLSFTYTSSQPVNMRIALNTATSNLFPLEAATDKEYTFDLGILMEKGGWNGNASGLVITFEDGAGATVVMKEPMVRMRNAIEAGRYYVYGPATQVSAAVTYEEITEYDTYGYHTFRLLTNNTAMGNNQVFFGTIDGGLTADKHFVSFEYNIASTMANLGMQFYLTPQGAATQMIQFYPFWASGASVTGQVAEGNLPLAGHWGEWMSMTVDLNRLQENPPQYTANPSGVFSNICAMGPFSSQNLRLQFAPAAANIPILIRGLHFHPQE